MMMDNGGIFVCKCRHLVLAGASQSKAGGQGVGGGGGLPGLCQLVVIAITIAPRCHLVLVWIVDE